MERLFRMRSQLSRNFFTSSSENGLRFSRSKMFLTLLRVSADRSTCFIAEASFSAALALRSIDDAADFAALSSCRMFAFAPDVFAPTSMSIFCVMPRSWRHARRSAVSALTLKLLQLRLEIVVDPLLTVRIFGVIVGVEIRQHFLKCCFEEEWIVGREVVLAAEPKFERAFKPLSLLPRPAFEFPLETRPAYREARPKPSKGVDTFRRFPGPSRRCPNLPAPLQRR